MQQGFVEMDIPALRGMQTVRVSKEEVLKKLRSNREAHRAIFEDALEGWHTAVLERLEEMLTNAKANKKFVPSIHLPQPQDHTKDYDRVIELLSMSLDDELELTQVEFSQYVMDDWNWRGDFITTANTYTAGSYA